MKTVALVFFLMSNLAFAGGVTCKECPAESNACAPKPDCDENHMVTLGLSPNCAPYFKLIACKEDCAYSADQQNTAISQVCIESCMARPCH
jgi:hypothetical protein